MKKLLTSPDVIRTRICAIDAGGKGTAGAIVCTIADRAVAAAEAVRPPTEAGVNSLLWRGGEGVDDTSELSYPTVRI